MRRYALTSLLIGVLVAAAVLGLYFAGVFQPLAGWLAETYRASGLFREETEFRAGWLEIVLIAVTAVGAAWCLVDIPHLGHKILVFMTILVVLLGISPTLALYGNLFEPFSSMASALLAATAGIIYAGTEQGMRKRVLQNVLGPRVSRSTFNSLMDSPEPPDFSGAVRQVSVVTVRVFNNAELRESLEPGELLKMSNLFLRAISDFLMSKGAYLDESSPDLVRVFFGLLKPSETYAEDACRAVLELRTRLENLNQECETRWFQRLQFGVAISSGPMTVGVYGSPRHYFYSGVGAETDFSRRLAHANLRYGSDILVSAETYRRVGDAAEVRPMEMFYDPDTEVMSEIYQIIGMKDQLGEEELRRRDLFWQGVILYRKGKYEDALDHFGRAKNPAEEDGPLEFFLTRTQDLLANPDKEPGEEHHELTDEGHARLLGMM